MSCLHWLKGGRNLKAARCPLFPNKQAFVSAPTAPALGHSARWPHVRATPALAWKVDGPFAIRFYSERARDKISLFLENLHNLKSFGEGLAEGDELYSNILSQDFE